MNEIVVRPAVLADLDVLTEFERGIIESEQPLDHLIRTDDDVRYYDLTALIASPDVELVVAELDGKPIGCGYARIETSKAFLQHHQHAYLGFMFVRPDHRRKGVNKFIMMALEAWCAAKGVSVLQLEVYTANQAAIRAYERAGFTRNILEMRKSLEESG